MTPTREGARRPDLEPPAVEEDEAMEPALQMAFAPLHKRAFGIATGTAGAAFMVVITAVALANPRSKEFPLLLLRQFFAGYSVSWRGLLVGAAWGFVVAFVAGWFAAFCRNLALAITAFMIRARAELTETRDFLDHI